MPYGTNRWIGYLALLWLPVLAFGQGDATRVRAKARFEPAQAKPGAEVVLIVEATVEAGYHVYGANEELGLPVALKVDDAAGLTAEGSATIPPGEPHTSAFGSQEHWIEGAFTLRQTFLVPEGLEPGERTLRGHVAYQACNEHLCEPPAQAAFQAPLEVLEGEATEAGSEASWSEAPRILYRARFEPESAAPGSTVKLILDVTTDEGWHLYGSLEEGSVPTTLTFPEARGLEVVEVDVPPGERKEPFPDFVTYVLPHAFRIEAKLLVPEAMEPGRVDVAGNLHYMACTDETCDPAQDAKFSAALNVVASAPQEPWKEALRIRYRTRVEPKEVKAGGTLRVIVEIETEDGWHLYGSLEEASLPTTLTFPEPRGLKLLEVNVPPGERKEPFPDFVSYELPHAFRIEAQLRVPETMEPGRLELGAKLGYMACTEETCTPAQDLSIAIPVTIVEGRAVDGQAEGRDGRAETDSGTQPAEANPATREGAGEKSVSAEEPAGDEASAVAVEGGGVEGKDKGLLWFLLAAVGAGLFALVMPCTYPMIPITISFFTKQADARHGRVLPLALAYGAGIVSIFVVIGVTLGPLIIEFANHEITNLVIGLLFLAFALSLFGMFELRPPAFLMRGASQASSQGGYLGVFLMGATLVVTSFTCTGPFVGSILSIGGQQLSLFQVALGMAVFGLTMALPFVVLSLIPGKLKALPKSGSWMDTVKVTLGFVELAASLKFFSNAEYTLGWNVLPVEYFLLTWAVIFLVMGYYLLGKIQLAGKDSYGISPGRMVIATVTLVFAAYCGFIAWTRTPVTNFIMVGLVPPYTLQETMGDGQIATSSTSGGAARANVAKVIKDDYEKAVQVAEAEHKALLVNFTGYN